MLYAIEVLHEAATLDLYLVPSHRANLYTHFVVSRGRAHNTVHDHEIGGMLHAFPQPDEAGFASGAAAQEAAQAANPVHRSKARRSVLGCWTVFLCGFPDILRVSAALGGRIRCFLEVSF
jgi:hypothetical protein